MKYYMGNISRGLKDFSNKTVIAKIENDKTTNPIWDPDNRIEGLKGINFSGILWQDDIYGANQIIRNIFEWAAIKKLKI